MQTFFIQMNDFCNRLKAERKRLKLNQEEFAALGGVKKGAQFNYENGSRAPDTEYLYAIAKAGVDLAFLMTGDVPSALVTDDEAELLGAYRSLDLKGKARVLGVLEGMVAASPPQAKSSAIFHGPVGQQVTGDIQAPQTFNVGRSKK